MLISEAGAANDYRTPIHRTNPLTGETRPEPNSRRVEDWATIAQATVDDARVPYIQAPRHKPCQTAGFVINWR